MISKVLNWIAARAPITQELVKHAQQAETAARKIEQGYRERWIQPRHELDVLIQNRENIGETVSKYKKIKYG